MIGYDLVRAVIGDVEEIVAEPIQEFDEMPLCQQRIFVRAKQGEMFQLVLQAETKQALKFRKEFKSEWLTPKVYKGDPDEEVEDRS